MLLSLYYSYVHTYVHTVNDTVVLLRNKQMLKYLMHINLIDAYL